MSRSGLSLLTLPSKIAVGSSAPESIPLKPNWYPKVVFILPSTRFNIKWKMMSVQEADHTMREKSAAQNFCFERTLIKRNGFSRRKFLKENYFLFPFFLTFGNEFHQAFSSFLVCCVLIQV